MVKKKYVIIAFILGLMISVSGVYAAESIIESINVSYDNGTSGGKYTTVQESIDELYEKSGLLKEKWVDPVLNGADPVLEVEGSTKKLIPITIDNDGIVRYANLKTKWYDYSDKKWANAVILVDNPKNGTDKTYTYKTGDIINENDIESYFVWIPRYSYKIWNMANTEEYMNAIDTNTLINKDYNTSVSQIMNKSRIIDVKFGDVRTNPKMSENEATLDNYYTHPAFTLGDKDLNGIWVGKFETGYNQDGNNGEPFTIDASWTTVGANQNKEASNRIIIKPNVYSWRNNTVSNMFLSAYNYDRTLESHMMKNTEWGVVVYLSHSAYGIGNEVKINNNKEFKTGYAAYNTNQDTSNSNINVYLKSWNTNAGFLASTTGNITGVYDMSGGAVEYVGAYKKGSLGKSGLTDENEFLKTYENYLNIYNENSTVNSYKYRILGDATGEMGPFYKYYEKDNVNRFHNSWYSDTAFFVSGSNPWFVRGGRYDQSSHAGQFYFYSFTGELFNNVGFRIVLSPK